MIAKAANAIPKNKLNPICLIGNETEIRSDTKIRNNSYRQIEQQTIQFLVKKNRNLKPRPSEMNIKQQITQI